MKPIEPRVYPPPIAEEAVQRFSSREIEQISAYLIWHEQKLRVRRHRDHRCIACGHKRERQGNKSNFRCKTCQAYRRERLRKMTVSVRVTEES